MNNKEITILIEMYLDGRLPETEKKDFEKRIKKDKELQSELILHKAIRETVEEDNLMLLRTKINTLTNDFKKKKRKQKIILNSSIMLSAIIILIFSINIFINQKVDYDEIYNQYYTRFSSGAITKGEEIQEKDLIKSALFDYELRKYDETINKLNQITDTSSYYYTKEFFTALSYMELKEFKKSTIHFENTLKSKDTYYYDSAIWYCGLSYLKSMQKEKAIQKFELLKDACLIYKQNSEEILKKIK